MADGGDGASGRGRGISGGRVAAAEAEADFELVVANVAHVTPNHKISKLHSAEAGAAVVPGECQTYYAGHAGLAYLGHGLYDEQLPIMMLPFHVQALGFTSCAKRQ